MSEIPKAYEPTAVEEKWYQFWLDQKCFVADPARVSETRPAFSPSLERNSGSQIFSTSRPALCRGT